MNQKSVRFCGFGGQGIILSAVILGTAAVTKRNLFAVQTQSYGSEARGGECQSELIISDEVINSPTVQEKDILVAMAPNALNKYISTLKENGTLIVDSKLIKDIPDVGARVIEIPATEMAVDIGNRLVSNMVVLGLVQEMFQLVTKEDLLDVVEDTVPAKYLDLNVQAVEAGIEFAKNIKSGVEV